MTFLHWLAETLRAHPEIALFATLALGYGISRLRLGPIQLNAVVAVLLAGVLLGQLGIKVPDSVQWTFFALFLFSIGYQTGPQFFRGLGRSALPQVGLALLLCGTALATAFALAKVFGFDAGQGAGLLAGGMNASAAIGTGGDAIAKLTLDPAVKQGLSTGLAVAFAVTYLVGLLTEIVVLTIVAPWLMRTDLAAECRKLEEELGVETGDLGVVSAYQEVTVRAYTVPETAVGRMVVDLERLFEPARVFAQRIRTAEGIEDVSPRRVLQKGDVVALTGRVSTLAGPDNPLAGAEVNDPDLLNIPTVTVEVILTAKAVAGQTLGRLRDTIGREEFARGVLVRQITRTGKLLPLGLGTVVERGDVVTLVGPNQQVAQFAAALGTALSPASSTDMVALAAAVALGGLVGLATVRLGGLDVGLSMPVGILLGGLIAGWLRSTRPALARVPEPVLRIFDSIGLTGFLAVVGINAGPGFVRGLGSSGPALVLAGVLVCLIPNLVTILAGRYLFRLHPGVLLGICAGAGTSPAGLAALQEKAKSRIPTLGYGVSYAVGNLLLALWGSVLVMALGT